MWLPDDTRVAGSDDPATTRRAAALPTPARTAGARGRLRVELQRARGRLRSASTKAIVWNAVFAGLILSSSISGDLSLLDVARGAVGALALLMRYVWPTAALLVACCLPGPPAVPIIAVPTLAYGAGLRIGSGRRKFLVVALASVLATIVWFLARPAGTAWELWVAFVGTGAVLLVVVPGALGAIRAERRKGVDALNERNAVLEQAVRLGNVQAKLQERARIAGEMHDLLGHRLSLIALYAGGLELRSHEKAPELSSEASLLRTTATTALAELREVLGILRVDERHETAEGPDDGVGTRADIAGLTDASRLAGLAVELGWTGADLVGAEPRVRRAVHRVVRESLTNAHKHAPGSLTKVTIVREPRLVRVEVSSGAAGPAAPRAPGTGLGLVGLQERVKLAGGTFSAGRAHEGAPFVVAASLPLAGPEGVTP